MVEHVKFKVLKLMNKWLTFTIHRKHIRPENFVKESSDDRSTNGSPRFFNDRFLLLEKEPPRYFGCQTSNLRNDHSIFP